MRYFCTYFDSGYLSRALALYDSMEAHSGPFCLWALCLDEDSYKTLSRMELPNLRLISLEEFERGDAALLHAKTTRSRIEYYFTCTPSLPLYVFDQNPEVDLLTYLDADLFFFGDLSPIYDEIGSNSIAIIEHRYPPTLRQHEPNGIYNVGWLSFRRDENGLACLRWWRERCLEWCYDHIDEGRFADQGYLNDWPERFAGVIVLQHKGVNLAPWNLVNYRIKSVRHGVLVDDQPLLVFHFHGLKNARDAIYDPQLERYGVRLSLVILHHIYAPYIRSLRTAARRLIKTGGKRIKSASARPSTSSIPAQRVSLVRRIARKVRSMWRGIPGLWRRNYIFVIKEKII